MEGMALRSLTAHPIFSPDGPFPSAEPTAQLRDGSARLASLTENVLVNGDLEPCGKYTIAPRGISVVPLSGGVPRPRATGRSPAPRKKYTTAYIIRAMRRRAAGSYGQHVGEAWVVTGEDAWRRSW